MFVRESYITRKFFGLLLLSATLSATALAEISDPVVEYQLARYESAPSLNTSFVVPSVPERVQVCLVTDTTGSYRDDIDNLNEQIGSIVSIVSDAESAQFGLATFEDYPVSPYGG